MRCSRGFSTCKALGGDAWRVFWKVPTAGAGAAADRGGAAGGLRAAAGGGVAVRRGGLRGGVGGDLSRAGCEGGEIRIEGLERTATDVLVRYELAPGKAESQRLTAATTGFTVPAPQGRLGVSRPTSRSGSIISCGGSTT